MSYDDEDEEILSEVRREKKKFNRMINQKNLDDDSLDEFFYEY